MNDDTQQQAPRGRSLQVRAFGDTAAALELAALDEARLFFGDELILRVVPDCQARPVTPYTHDVQASAGKKYRAYITVEVREP